MRALNSYLPPPDVFDGNERKDTSIGEWEGRLYICKAYYLEKLDLWVMKNDGTVKSWTKYEGRRRLFTIGGTKFNFEAIGHIPSIISLEEAVSERR
ncbi:hypothetical protein L6164_031163 [Bauhinia variegata]|uniref:Uncharacterized protein n=1 Tax=Bauhinia variegata TaxID=167791 RepID=A0ACB9LEL2_BAUVA|nr:hypothetical protein L6164_031163 [Bauhinia variegata]